MWKLTVRVSSNNEPSYGLVNVVNGENYAKRFARAVKAQEEANELNERDGYVTKAPKFEKVGCSVWDIVDLRDDFEAGNLFFKGESTGKMLKVNKVATISVCIENGSLYRKVAPPTLEEKLAAFGITLDSSGGLVLPDNTYKISQEAILELAELIKSHQ